MDRQNHQAGMTFVSWLVTLIGVGLVALVTIRLVPVYIEAYEVGSILRSMADDPQLKEPSQRELRRTFEKRLNINSIEFISEDDLKVKEVEDGLQLTVNYEARVDLLGNLDAVAHFHKEVTIRN